MDEVSATWSSRVRGLFLGLALGDAVGSMRGDIPSAGPLAAGAATQLAAWTAEGTLRMHTRYADPLREADTDLVLFAYQRWALLRGAEPAPDAPWFPLLEVRDLPTRGWLVDVPAMAGTRGSSPSTFSAVTTGIPVRSSGCQAMLRSLPLAAYLGRSVGSSEERRPLVTDLTRRLAALTHSHPDAAAAATPESPSGSAPTRRPGLAHGAGAWR